MSEVPRAAKDGSSAQATSSAVTYELPWVEKYRPTRLDDVVGNSATVDRLKVIQEDGNCPHLLISGLPGIGKTTSVHCLAHALLGDAYKEGVLELNASDERGIDVVRNKIKNFAQKTVTLTPGRHKIIILIELRSACRVLKLIQWEILFVSVGAVSIYIWREMGFTLRSLYLA